MTNYITLHDLTSREKDAVLLGRIAGSEYHEVSYVLRTDASGAHQIVGRASDWPLIQLRAENTEQAALLIAATQQAEQADALALAAQSRLVELEAQVLALRAALIPPALAAAATGLAVEPARAELQLLQCPECPKQFGSKQALATHRANKHGYRNPGSVAPTPMAALARENGGWRCANKSCPGAFTRSMKNEDYCTECAKTQPIGSSNGHEREVGASV